jgi:tRNA threonylcarbamoyladenosine biosynthesis protein TsaB
MSAPLILHIETSTAVCSVALSKGLQLLALKEDCGGRNHARQLAVFIDEILKEQKFAVSQLDAVSVSEGPGSYTGLRVGVSTAKGICYGAQKPLIAVNSLQSLAFLAIENHLLPTSDCLIVPMIDARRMEVYTAVFDASGKLFQATEAKIIDANSFNTLLAQQHRLVFLGDGAEKCSHIVVHENAVFVAQQASASGMIKPALEIFTRQQFVNTAYFEPFYLKDFVVSTTARKKL